MLYWIKGNLCGLVVTCTRDLRKVTCTLRISQIEASTSPPPPPAI